VEVDPKFGLEHIEAVTIMGQEIQIKHRKPKKDSHGECDADQRTIELNKDLKGAFAVRVLIHELTHSGLRLSGVDYHLTEAAEEQICTLMESMVPEIATIIIGAINSDIKEKENGS
jgi:hypothetical protein